VNPSMRRHWVCSPEARIPDAGAVLHPRNLGPDRPPVAGRMSEPVQGREERSSAVPLREPCAPPGEAARGQDPSVASSRAARGRPPGLWSETTVSAPGEVSDRPPRVVPDEQEAARPAALAAPPSAPGTTRLSRATEGPLVDPAQTVSFRSDGCAQVVAPADMNEREGPPRSSRQVLAEERIGCTAAISGRNCSAPTCWA
jgi:hypothetical protein